MRVPHEDMAAGERPGAILRVSSSSGPATVRARESSPGRNIDWPLVVVQFALSGVGLAIIYSASRTKAADPYLFVTRQEIFLIVAVAAMAVVMSVDYSFWRNHALVLYVGTLVALVGVRVVGTVSSGARLSFGVGAVKLQPGELAKLTVLVALAASLSKDLPDREAYPRFLRGLLIVAGPAVLIMAQPDFGTTSVILAMGMGVLLVGGAKMRYIVLITVMSVITGLVAFRSGLVKPYQVDRFIAFFHQNSSDPKYHDILYQSGNAVQAVATGGLSGRGWLAGPITNAPNDIPVQWADFPTSAVGEQFGFAGCAGLIGLFIIVLLRVWRISYLSRDSFGTYICAGVFTMLLWQIFQNVGMTIGIMPVTGLPLPFISYGGSGVVATFIMIGLVQSVHMRRFR